MTGTADAKTRSLIPPSFAVEHPDHAWRDYLNGDVPSFYRVLGERDLRNSAGDLVNVRDVIAWQRRHLDDPGALVEDCGRGGGPGQTTSTMAHFFPISAVDMALAQLDSNRRNHRADRRAFIATMLDGIVPASTVITNAVGPAAANTRKPDRKRPKVATQPRTVSSQPRARRRQTVPSSDGEEDNQ